jgi:pyruvate dehydrogenase E1 component
MTGWHDGRAQFDGHPHTLAFLAGVNRVHHIALGVSRYGQVGSLDEVYRYHGLDADSIVAAALDILGAPGEPRRSRHDS